MPHPEQPLAILELGEYELQVMETIATHAIDAGALSPALFQVVGNVQDKIKAARSELVILRRRLAMSRAQDGTTAVATTSAPEDPSGA